MLFSQWKFVKDFNLFSFTSFLRLCLYFTGFFCVYDKTDTVSYLVTNQIIFYTGEQTKKLNLKYSFYIFF